MKVPELIPQYQSDAGALAVYRLFLACFDSNRESAEAIAEFLVSLYDARCARLDVYALCRRVPGERFDDILAVMRWFRFAENGFDIHQVVGREPGEELMENIKEKVAMLKGSWF